MNFCQFSCAYFWQIITTSIFQVNCQNVPLESFLTHSRLNCFFLKMLSAGQCKLLKLAYNIALFLMESLKTLQPTLIKENWQLHSENEVYVWCRVQLVMLGLHAYMFLMVHDKWWGKASDTESLCSIRVRCWSRSTNGRESDMTILHGIDAELFSTIYSPFTTREHFSFWGKPWVETLTTYSITSTTTYQDMEFVSSWMQRHVHKVIRIIIYIDICI